MAALAINDLPDGRRVLALDGRLDSNTVRAVWSDSHRALADAPGKPVTVDAAKVDYCDGAGVALLIDLIAQERAAPVEIANLKPAFELLLKQFDPKRVAKDIDPEVKRRPAIEEMGRAAAAATELEKLGARLSSHPVFGRVDVAADHAEHGLRLAEVEGESSRQPEQALYSALGQVLLSMKLEGAQVRYGLAPHCGCVNSARFHQ